MDDLLREFLTESSESLDTVDNQLVQFEQDPNNAKILDNIFRLVHTIKGTCGFLGLPRLEALAHAGETLMGKFRDGMPVKAEAVTLILSSIDRIERDPGRARGHRSRARRQRPRPDRSARSHGRARHGRDGGGRRLLKTEVPVADEAPAGERRRLWLQATTEGTLVVQTLEAARASGRGLARRARARLPRDAIEVRRRLRPRRPRCRKPQRLAAEPWLPASEAGPQGRRRGSSRKATRSPTSRSGSMSTPSNIMTMVSSWC